MCNVNLKRDARSAIQGFLYTDIQRAPNDHWLLEQKIEEVETGPAGSYWERNGNAHRLQIFAGQAFIESTVAGVNTPAVAVPLSVLKEEVVRWGAM